MAEVLFYHLERAKLDDVLPGLLEKTLERGWRAVVRTGDETSVQHLDERLWTYRDESFLPHSADPSAEIAAKQPIWLTTTQERANEADVLFAVDGGTIPTDDLQIYTRCILIFDGSDEDALGSARAQWKEVKAADVEATYWRQSPEGRWEKQA